MNRRNRVLLVLTVAVLLVGLVLDAFVMAAPASSADDSRRWSWPLQPQPEVVETFDPPEDPYGPGHRGVDLAGRAGQPVFAVAPGRVRFAGLVAGRGVLVIDHHGERSTYEPIDASVSVGAVVRTGQPVGRLDAAGSHCWPAVCLHLGRIAGDTYRDPLELLGSGGGPVRLLPFHAPPKPASPGGPGGPGGWLSWPVSGAYITSPYGMRFHPILHYDKLHDGTDFGVACGTPVYAAASGTVISAYDDSAYGNRITINHGNVNGVSLSTSYNHLTSFVASSGHVERGELIGYSGTTGWSTGCHLHFMVYENGATVDPMSWL